MKLTGRLYAVLLLLCLWAAPQSVAHADDWLQAHGFLSVEALVDASTRREDPCIDASIDPDDASGFAEYTHARRHPVFASARQAPDRGDDPRTAAHWSACHARAPPAPRA